MSVIHFKVAKRTAKHSFLHYFAKLVSEKQKLSKAETSCCLCQNVTLFYVIF